MTGTAVHALERLSEYVLALVERISPEDWNKPSACPGWSVHDVIIHLTATLREVAEPDTLPPGVSGDIEATNERQVEHFRIQPPAQTMENYRRLLPAALRELRQMQAPARRDILIDFDNAGKYPAHLVADSLVFDHYCHLRHDLSEPRGPLENAVIPATREFLEPSLNWLMAGLPQMSPDALAAVLNEPVRIFLSGPGGSSWVLSRNHDGHVKTERADDMKVAATIITDADAFILWGTHRISPTEAASLLAVRGNRALGRLVQQHIHVY
ncbi:maleylpyruvate isomerase family mycothiol-dependent enzyme [Paenarthrobacter aurescens]|uniref:maleylpyruvate isomerase family mycothiol-dependent enzyme n=1 Tax=Paenarthrobacter aurescens TaxID=43663 RepID=UPI0035F07303